LKTKGPTKLARQGRKKKKNHPNIEGGTKSEKGSHHRPAGKTFKREKGVNPISEEEM